MASFDTDLITGDYGGTGTNNDLSYNFPPCEILSSSTYTGVIANTTVNHTLNLKRNITNTNVYTVISTCPTGSYDSYVCPTVVISNITSTSFKYNFTICDNCSGSFNINFLVIYNLDNLDYYKSN